MTDDARPIRVHLFYLTDTVASEQLYGRELTSALADAGATVVDDWRRADVVHLLEVNLLTRDTLTAFRVPTLLRVLRSETPVVVSTDDLYFTGDPSLTARPGLYPINHRLQRWLFRRCDAVIALSESVRRRLSPYLPETPVSVVHHGVADRYFAPATGGADPLVLHVSLASRRKNPAAVAEVADRCEGRFVVAGGGWDEHVPERAREDAVEVRGYVPEGELVDLYRDADVFYFPTRHEGFGLPVLEAMAASTAVVSSDVYSVPEVTGDAAVLHDPTAVDDHLESIHGLLADEDRRTDLAERARDRAREFTWADSARETLAVYRSVIEPE